MRYQGSSTLAVGALDVALEQGFVVGESERVVGRVVGLGGLAVLAEAHGRRVLLPRREVLVLGDPGVGGPLFAVVDHRVALVVALVVEPLEHERPVA